MMLGKSNYREMGSDKDQFYFDIIGECRDKEMNNEDSYICMLLPKYQKEYQMGDKPFNLRKRLFGDKENLYSIVEENKHNGYEQLSLLDFIGE